MGSIYCPRLFRYQCRKPFRPFLQPYFSIFRLLAPLVRLRRDAPLLFYYLLGRPTCACFPVCCVVVVGTVRSPVAFCDISLATLPALEVEPDVVLSDVPPETHCSAVDCGFLCRWRGGRADA